MQKLPIGIQTFETIRQEDYLYIDKTKQILQMIENGKCYFLSRPRRFGKSLTISTLESMFKGKTELFKGLYAENWVKKQSKNPNPVIKLDMSPFAKYKDSESLNDSIIKNLERFLFINDLDYPSEKNAGDMLANIITRLYKQFGKVVVLIDEYDKPITDNINDLEKAEEIRDSLKSFYSVLKSNSDYLQFVMLTGVSKFSKAGVFSGLNNLQDISMKEEYSDIVGYTQKELEDNFSDWLEKATKKIIFNKRRIIAKNKKKL